MSNVKTNAIEFKGMSVAWLDDFEQTPDQEQATAIIKAAVAMSGQDVVKAIKVFGEQFGWTSEDCRQEFVTFCKARARAHGMKDIGYDSQTVARYVSAFAGDDAEKMQSYKP